MSDERAYLCCAANEIGNAIMSILKSGGAKNLVKPETIVKLRECREEIVKAVLDSFRKEGHK